ncbi:MAG TPA: hypothetical protein VD838_13240 [Anaeromyxobacteraceae bacterium]|nr:hypothetical protein [Anaeromyxobacteraceae bacterium]
MKTTKNGGTRSKLNGLLEEHGLYTWERDGTVYVLTRRGEKSSEYELVASARTAPELLQILETAPVGGSKPKRTDREARRSDRQLKDQMVRDARAQVGRVRGLKWLGYRWTVDEDDHHTLAGVRGFCRRCGAMVELTAEEAKTYNGHNCK